MIVMKFGGTSVQDAPAIDRVAAIVRGRLAERPVVVVSALARITDQLLAMASAAGAGHRDQALELSCAARQRHYNTAADLLGTHAFEQIAPELEADFNGLDELLRGVVAVGELTPRVVRCFEAGALATGSHLEIVGGDKPYAHMVHDTALALLCGRCGDLGQSRDAERPVTHRAPRDDRRAGVGRYRWPARHETQ